MKPKIARVAAGVLAAGALAAGLGCRSDPPPHRGTPSGQVPGPAEQIPAPVEPAGQPAAGGTAAGGHPAAAPGAAAPVTTAYAGDIAKLCEVVQLSGAAEESPEDRRLPIANWLAANLTTAESRQFLARIQPLVGDRKADALDAEARRVGLADCSLAAEWRTPPP